AKEVVSGLLVTEWGLLLLPAGGVAWASRLDLRATFSLRLPSWSGLAAALLVAGSAWSLAMLAAAASQLVLPVPEAFVEQLRRFFHLPREQLAMPGLLFLFAISPAVCEEVAFRGFILAGLRSRLGCWPTVLTVGLLFGLFHLSAYRFLPTALLGVVIALVVWQTGSIFTGMLVHFATNALIFASGSTPWLAAAMGLQGDEVASFPVVALYLVPLGLGLALLARLRSPGTTG
ncbi:MAG: CPBP family intramembrane metalloprotease, partial [Deltaproteobacteria bacterium]|nr:CPBP family intramembrane metalloprotease [Deltaproteobacteria bacterium]